MSRPRRCDLGDLGKPRDIGADVAGPMSRPRCCEIGNPRDIGADVAEPISPMSGLGRCDIGDTGMPRDIGADVAAEILRHRPDIGDVGPIQCRDLGDIA